MKFVPNPISQKVFHAAVTFQKHSPNIMFAGGLIGVVGSTVLACRATLKLADELPEMKLELENVVENPRALSEIDHKREVGLVYGANAARVIKTYAPAVLLGGVSIAALTGSHVALTRRNAGLTAAYAAVSRAYEEYRGRVQKELGYDREAEIYQGVTTKKIETENGKKETVLVVDPNKLSPYARFFDECSRNWKKDAELNKLFIKCQESYCNNILQSRGHLFLNEVYDMLGFEHTQAGSVVGWVIGDSGDNYVDFGMYKEGNERFVNGIERSILLDFNVDGVIYDKI